MWPGSSSNQRASLLSVSAAPRTSVGVLSQEQKPSQSWWHQSKALHNEEEPSDARHPARPSPAPQARPGHPSFTPSDHCHGNHLQVPIAVLLGSALLPLQPLAQPGWCNLPQARRCPHASQAGDSKTSRQRCLSTRCQWRPKNIIILLPELVSMIGLLSSPEALEDLPPNQGWLSSLSSSSYQQVGAPLPKARETNPPLLMTKPPSHHV